MITNPKVGMRVVFNQSAATALRGRPGVITSFYPSPGRGGHTGEEWIIHVRPDNSAVIGGWYSGRLDEEVVSVKNKEGKFWMVTGKYNDPKMRHKSEANAKAEAERLAKQHPGESFYVLEAKSVSTTASVVTSKLV